MSRHYDGWEYGEWGARWAPTTEVALANITVGQYGDEYEDTMRELLDLVRAAQRDAAELLKEAGHEEAAALIYPTYPEESE
ncbi:hypothetical protein SEA_RANA_62 [Streptomyces phage Rana]|uniref:Uncharacterized protein n=2 Tax=Likavirus TaxID=1982880 RepID=A0A1C9LWM0_9CAUD|nr:hypothetical protein M050_gp62 [Streptomyces phage Sujidade]YP_010056690.1 hypothetical protein KGH01_gp61 [Streptomyces phage Lorelei]AGM12160.1 hypothetical protein SUJIDADE_62 [Streptomyces phage Sujidade]AOQ26975.1 hypothetical protein SEA_LORELEI_61 [Streptomyces phage Lorelei]AWN07280.1 hypothetical protein SEA_RANA_62 [Streptomyces phage Rana]